MRIDDDRKREEAAIDRVHRQESYRYALQQHIRRLKKYDADIGGGNSYPLIKWSTSDER